MITEMISSDKAKKERETERNPHLCDDHISLHVLIHNNLLCVEMTLVTCISKVFPTMKIS